MADRMKFASRLFRLGAPLTMALVASAMILGVGALQVARSYEGAMASAFLRIDGRGKSVSMLTDSSLLAVDLAVSSLAEDLTAGIGAPTLSEVLDRRIRLLEQASDLVVLDDGRRWHGHAESVVSSPPGVETASLEWHRSHPSDRQVHVETLFDSGAPGHVAIVISKAITGPKGDVSGVVAAVLNPTFFETLYRDMIVAPLGSLSLWREDGHALIRYPPMPQKMGQDFHATKLAGASKQQTTGSYRIRHSAIDGSDRLVNYRRLEHFPMLLVATSTAVEDVVTPWLQNEITQVAAIALGVIIMLGMGFVTARHRRREAEAARIHRADEALFRGVFENATDHLFVYRLAEDGTFVIDAINPAAARATGRDRDDLIGQNAVDVLSPRIAARVVADLNATITAGDVIRFESHGLLYGKMIFNEVVQVPLANADGVFDRVFVGARDVTHFKTADARLRELNGRLLLAEQMAHVGHWRLELPSRETFWSDEVYRIYGLDPSTPVLGMEAAIAAYHPDDRDELARVH